MFRANKNKGLSSAALLGFEQTLASYLAKPKPFCYNLTTDVANTTIIQKDIPEDIFSDTMYSNKLQGFLGFRGTAVLRLQVNASKFHQGKLLLHFLPQAQVSGMYPGIRNRSLLAKTMQPSMVFNIGENTEVELKVPYISPTPYYNLSDESGPFGRVYVTVYSPLVTGTSEPNAGVTLWVSFEDVEVVTPHCSEMDTSEAEASALGKKPISTVLNGVADVGTILSTVPQLSFLGIPSWCAKIAAGSLSALGYSKPTDTTPSTKYTGDSAPNAQNCDGTYVGKNLGLCSDNSVVVDPSIFGTSVDEMSIAHILSSRWMFHSTTTWADTDAADTQLVTMRLEPAVFRDTTDPDYVDGNSIWYLSNFFRYWRGGIKMRISIVKTSLHSGRLALTWNPMGLAKSGVTNNMVLREIIDIGDKSTFDFVLPYASTRQYHECAETNDSLPHDPMGAFDIRVLNPLKMPDTASNSVQIILQFKACDDFEFMCPRPLPVRDAGPQVPFVETAWTTEMDAHYSEMDVHAYEYTQWTSGASQTSITLLTSDTVDREIAGMDIIYKSATRVDEVYSDNGRVRCAIDIYQSSSGVGTQNLYNSNFTTLPAGVVTYRSIQHSMWYGFTIHVPPFTLLAGNTLYLRKNIGGANLSSQGTGGTYTISVEPTPVVNAGKPQWVSNYNAWNTHFAQMDTRDEEAVGIGGSKEQNSSIVPSSYCAGERILSTLQLCKRFTPIHDYTGEKQYNTAGLTARAFAMCAMKSSDTSAKNFYGDYLSYIMPLYAYSRGSVRWMDFSRVGSDTILGQAFPSDDVQPLTTGTYTANLLADAPLCPSTVDAWPNNFISNVQVPPYMQNFIRLNRFSWGTANEPVDQYTSKMSVGFSNTVSNYSSNQRVYRAAGDDFSLGCFIGTVPLVKSTTA